MVLSYEQRQGIVKETIKNALAVLSSHNAINSTFFSTFFYSIPGPVKLLALFLAQKYVYSAGFI